MPMTPEELDYANAQAAHEQDEKDRIQYDDTPDMYQGAANSPYSMTNAVNKYNSNRYGDYIKGLNDRDQQMQNWKRLGLDKERVDNDERQKNYQNIIARQAHILDYMLRKKQMSFDEWTQKMLLMLQAANLYIMRDPEKWRQEHPDQRNDPYLDAMERVDSMLRGWGSLENTAESNRIDAQRAKQSAREGQQRISLDEQRLGQERQAQLYKMTTDRMDRNRASRQSVLGNIASIIMPLVAGR